MNFYESLYEHADGLIELRALPSRARAFVRPGGHGLFCRKHQHEDIYFGVATRDGRGGKKINIVQIPAVWADVDFKATPINDARALLRRFPFKPSMTVLSGGGVHLYWKLSEPAGQDAIENVEGVNRRIVKALSGDPTGTEAARILRVPGTVNRKYTPPRQVKLVQKRSFQYELEDFEILPTVKPKSIIKQQELTAEQRSRLTADIPPCIRFIIEKAPHDVSRGRSFNALVVQLIVYFQAVGISESRALATADPFLRNCESGTYPGCTARLKHFLHIWRKLPEYNYVFNCSYILGLRLPGYAFDCQKCTVSEGRHGNRMESINV